MTALAKWSAVFVAVLASVVAVTPMDAQSNLTIARRTPQEPRVSGSPNFTGAVAVEPLFDSIASLRAFGASVSFVAGARTAWHTHTQGQMLIVTSGVGRVQQWGRDVEEIRVGDVIRIPPNVKHWHGGAPTSAMTHIAIVTGATEWMEAVTEEQFRAKVAGAPPESSNRRLR